MNKSFISFLFKVELSFLFVFLFTLRLLLSIDVHRSGDDLRCFWGNSSWFLQVWTYFYCFVNFLYFVKYILLISDMGQHHLHPYLKRYPRCCFLLVKLETITSMDIKHINYPVRWVSTLIVCYVTVFTWSDCQSWSIKGR